jgi:hypothetical protein
MRRRQSVLLECPWEKEPANLRTRTTRIHARETRWAIGASTRQPLDADPLALLKHRVFRARAKSNYCADTLVAADLTCGGGCGQPCPGVSHDAHVGVADAGVREIDEHFANARLRGLDLFDFGGDLAGLVVDEGLVAGGNLDVGHGEGELEM